MSFYRVHVYRLYRYVVDVEAACMEDAITKAEAEEPPDEIEKVEEVPAYYLVDIAGDEDFLRSQWFWDGDFLDAHLGFCKDKMAKEYRL